MPKSYYLKKNSSSFKERLKKLLIFFNVIYRKVSKVSYQKNSTQRGKPQK